MRHSSSSESYKREQCIDVIKVKLLDLEDPPEAVVFEKGAQGQVVVTVEINANYPRHDTITRRGDWRGRVDRA